MIEKYKELAEEYNKLRLERMHSKARMTEIIYTIIQQFREETGICIDPKFIRIED